MQNPALTEAVYYILLSLLSPMHGYGIMQNVEKLSGGRVKLAAGTLYGALNNLIGKGWIAALPGEADSRQKKYRITAAGIDALKGELDRLRELLENGVKIVEGLTESGETDETDESEETDESGETEEGERT